MIGFDAIVFLFGFVLVCSCEGNRGRWKFLPRVFFGPYRMKVMTLVKFTFKGSCSTCTIGIGLGDDCLYRTLLAGKWRRVSHCMILAPAL